MAQFLPTFVIALVFVLIAIGLMAIGWILTGRSRIIRGACGMDPKKLRSKKCGSKDIHCELCNKDKDILN